MKKAFSIIEIIIAVTIFSLLASFFIFSIIESYRINERSRDMSLATILAEEGLEAVRSIRDNDFGSLRSHPQRKSYCLSLEKNQWSLITNPGNPREDCFEPVGKFLRQIYIIGTGNVRRDVFVIVSWDLISGERRSVRLLTRLTNWRR